VRREGNQTCKLVLIEGDWRREANKRVRNCVCWLIHSTVFMATSLGQILGTQGSVRKYVPPELMVRDAPRRTQCGEQAQK
jgi:hypothetical protein